MGSIGNGIILRGMPFAVVPSPTPILPVTTGLLWFLDPSNPASYVTSTKWVSVSGSVPITFSATSSDTITKNSNSVTLTGTAGSGTWFQSSPVSLPSSTAWTIEAWVSIRTNSQDGTSPSLISQTPNNNTSQFVLGRPKVSGQLGAIGAITLVATNQASAANAANYTSGSFTSNITGSAGIFKQVVGTLSGSVYNLYINGALSTTGTMSNLAISTDIGLNNQPITINGFYPTNQGSSYSGSYGMIRMYGRNLTTTEVLQNFNANKALYGL